MTQHYREPSRPLSTGGDDTGKSRRCQEGASYKAHSWHPLPVLLWAPTCRPDLTDSFGERACMKASLGRFSAVDIMPLALGHALRLAKYGA